MLSNVSASIFPAYGFVDDDLKCDNTIDINLYKSAVNHMTLDSYSHVYAAMSVVEQLHAENGLNLELIDSYLTTMANTIIISNEPLWWNDSIVAEMTGLTVNATLLLHNSTVFRVSKIGVTVVAIVYMLLVCRYFIDYSLIKKNKDSSFVKRQ